MAKTGKGYAQLNKELEKILQDMQNPDIDIDTAMELYEKGQKLIVELENYLKTAETTVTKLKAKFSEE